VLESAALDGREVLGVPIRVDPGVPVSGLVLTMTDRPASLSGRISDAQGRPVVDLHVLAFPADESLRHPGSVRMPPPVRPLANGSFLFSDLPPGDYLLAALTDLGEELSDPAYLAQVAEFAVRVTVGRGQNAVQDIRVGGG
jgi:hypothetical protein